MYALNGQTVTFVAGFTNEGAAAPGLTVTCKVWELRGAGVKSPNDTTGTTATVYEIGGGAYAADYTVGANCVPLAVFSTAGTADVTAIQTAALTLTNLDATVSSRNATAPLDAAGTRTAVGLASANLDTQLTGISSKTTNLPSDPADQSALAAAIAAASLLGSGDKQVQLVIKNTLGVAIGDAEVTVTSDAPGDVPECGPVTTSANGKTPVLMLSAGTYYRWASKSGETFNNPQSFTVV